MDGIKPFSDDAATLITISATSALTKFELLPSCKESEEPGSENYFGTALPLVGMALLSLIEGVARLVFMTLTLTAVLFTFSKVEVLNTLAIAHGAFGALLSFENFIICSVAAFIDFSESEVEYDEIVPSLKAINESINDKLNFDRKVGELNTTVGTAILKLNKSIDTTIDELHDNLFVDAWDEISITT
ncbi:MAG: hypothetical protein HYX48_04410 [Chlamydiales bacterium]|nr:hypothetical protein [Chlamydiales bacterium]